MKSRAQADNPVFRVSSTLVQADAVVNDAKGHQITNHAASDFQLYADGKIQPSPSSPTFRSRCPACL